MCAVTRTLDWVRLPCFGHNLHLAVTNSIKGDARITRALGVCRKIVSTFSHSWKKKRALTEAQEALKLPMHALKSDCATRWGSTQLMIGRILEQKDSIRQVLRADAKTRHLSPTWQDIDVLESLEAALGALDTFTDALSGENCITVSAINAVLHIMKNDVLSESSSDTQLTADVKKHVLAYMEDKYEPDKVKSLLNIASFLDPRFCTSYIDNKDDVIDKITDEGVDILFQIEDAQSRSCSSTSTTEGSSDNSENQQSPAAKKRKLGSWLKGAASQPSQDDPTQPTVTLRTPLDKVTHEISQYEFAPRADPDSNPLLWWKVHGSEYFVLSKLAKKYLCVTASSAPSERVFSTSGLIVTKKRTLLKPDKVNQLVFLAKNL